MNFLPDPVQLAHIFSQATAPVFLLGATAGYLGLLMTRLKNITDRLGVLTKMPDSDPAAARFRQDIPELKQRAVLLNSAAYWALAGAMCTTLLLMSLVGSAFLQMQHIYGGGLLFLIATSLLTLSLFKFSREVKVEHGEIHRH